MEPSISVFSNVLEPTAAVLPFQEEVVEEVCWDIAYTNPKNRVRRLTLSDSYDWVFFGGDMNGCRYFVCPQFAIGAPPLRIDVFVMNQSGRSANLVAALGQLAPITTPAWKLQHQGFVLHLLHALQCWSENFGPIFREQYMSMPFGSRIVVESVVSNESEWQIHLLRVDEVELQMLSFESLMADWYITDPKRPQELRLEDLQLVSQAHEAISLVTISERHGKTVFVFKSASRDLSYLYHEIKTLLVLPYHPNVTSKPVYLVSKACRFGGKVGVCGFIQGYQPLGNLRDALRVDSHLSKHIDLQVQYRWTTEILSAIRHIKSSSVGFFSDLKPDNVLLYDSSMKLSTLLIDFEQRGAWCAWSPPEIYYVDYVDCIVKSRADIHDTARSKYKKLLQQYVDCRLQKLSVEGNRECGNGPSLAWSTLSSTEKEFAMVYMFGKLMWCIFELQPTINCGLGAEIYREVNTDHRFPRFRRTPIALQDLIAECTRGSKEWEGRQTPLIRVGDRLYPNESHGEHEEATKLAPEVQRAAGKWWNVEIAEAEKFLMDRICEEERCTVMELAASRPTLDRTLELLRLFGEEYNFL